MDDVLILGGAGTGLIDILSDYESLIWSVQYYGKSEFQLIVPATLININKLQIGRFLCRDSDQTATEYRNVMQIEKLQMDFDSEKGWLLTASGRGLKSILSRRIIWNQISVENTLIVSLISRVISENVSVSGNRKLFDIAVEYNASDFTEKADAQLFGENIADWMENVCHQYGYGWDIYIAKSSIYYRLKIYKGTNRSMNQNVNPPVIFSPEFDNLLTAIYQCSKETFANAALVGGEGEGTSKRSTSVGTATGLSRYETYIDGSGVSSNGQIITLQTYEKMLQEFGQLQLAEKKNNESLSGDIDYNGVYKIDQDFFLGDIVEVDTNQGVSATSRIIEILYSTDASGVAVIPTFSEMEVAE